MQLTLDLPACPALTGPRLAELGFSTRARNAVSRFHAQRRHLDPREVYQVMTLRDLLQYSHTDLQYARGLGDGTLREIHECLQAAGFELPGGAV